MLIRIAHRTDYRYDHPVLGSVQYLRLTPRSGPGQTVNSWRVSCQGADLTEWTDHFGNLCHTLVVKRPTSAIGITVGGEVRTYDTNGVLPPGLTALPPVAYLRGRRYTEPDAAIRKLAAAHRATLRKDRVAGLHTLMIAIHEAVAYSEGDTHVHTTAAEALAEGKGVCQDHAHLFIACCRHLGVPARYVSGYLGSGATAGTVQHSASHAWAEALVPDLGWVSFDPANAVSATELYVRVAVGFDYADASPIRGVRTGGGEEALDVVVELNGQQ